MVITDAGNVGIGDPLPDYKLHVNSGATNVVAKFESTDESAAIMLLDSGGNIELSASGNDFLVQPAGGAAALRVKSTGYAEFTGASDLRVTLSSQGTAGTNDSNWIRGNGTNISYNSASAEHRWEVGGSERMRLIPDGNASYLTVKAKATASSETANLSLYATNSGGFGGSVVSRATIQAVTDGTAFGAKLKMYTNGGIGAQANVETNHLTIHSGGQIQGSSSGRQFGLGSGWTTFGRLRSAQGSPLVIRVLGGHNSYGTYDDFVNDTYAYGISSGTVVNIGTTSTGNTSYTVSLRKVKQIGGDYATGDGGWEYQILRNTNHGYTVSMTVMGVHDGWVWVV
tara:strand:- start:422 stop:1444 length:1023 start_codon:yes stop_codon:yes gene_type:complete